MPAMSGAAAAAARDEDPGPSRELRTPQDRQGWFKLEPEKFTELCEKAYVNGDYSYVNIALMANHGAMKEFISKSAVTGTRAVTPEESYDLILMTQKMNSLLISVINRNMHNESESNKVRERMSRLEYNIDTAKATFDSVTKIAESIAEGRQKPSGFQAHSKPVSEYKAMQQLKSFAGERSKFREWNEKLLNALAQVNACYRKALKNLNSKLETMDGVLDEDEDDMTRILNDRLTANEYAKASPVKKKQDDDKGEYEVTEEHLTKLDEDLWYILNDKLEGIEPRGKLKGLREGDGLQAYQKIYKWYSAVTGVTLSAKMSLAMNPDKPKKIADVASQLEQWTALVETLEKYGPAYSLPLPFRITALRTIMTHAGDWFEGWHQENFKTPDSLTMENYQKLYVKCEDWARKKRLESDTQGNAAMEIGGIEGEKDKAWDNQNVWEVEGYVDDDGNWWSDAQWNSWEYDQEPGEGEDVNAVGKGKGKGKGVKCYSCGFFGHIAANCRRGKGKGKGNAKNGGRVTYGQYTKGKSYGKGNYGKGGKGQGSGGKGGYVPLNERECYKCGQKGHIAANCTSRGANEVEYTPLRQPPSFELGQPQREEIGHVDLAEPPGLNEVDPGWTKQRSQRRKEKREVKTRFNTHGCNSHDCVTENCNSWQSRIHASIKMESDWASKYAQVQLVEMSAQGPEVNAVPQNEENGDYEVVTVTLDSGAYNTVGPPKVGTYFPVKPTSASQSGKHYSAANGSVIHNYGQRVIKGRSEEGAEVIMPIQVADVGKVLGSAREFLDTGNRIVLDRDESGKPCSYMEHKATGHRTAVKEKRGMFQFEIRVPKGAQSEAVGEVRDRSDFPRQGSLAEDQFY